MQNTQNRTHHTVVTFNQLSKINASTTHLSTLFTLLRPPLFRRCWPFTFVSISFSTPTSRPIFTPRLILSAPTPPPRPPITAPASAPMLWVSIWAAATAPGMFISSFISARTPSNWISARATTSVFSFRFLAELVMDGLKLSLRFEFGGFGRTWCSDEATKERRSSRKRGASGRDDVVSRRIVGREAETLFESCGATASASQVIVVRSQLLILHLRWDYPLDAELRPQTKNLN